MEFMLAHWPQVSNFLSSGLGSLASALLGGFIIARAIHNTSSLPSPQQPVALLPDTTKTIEGNAVEKRPKTDLEWNFDLHKNYPFIGMSAPQGAIVVHDFYAYGKNLTGDPITNAHGYVRSDTTNDIYPLYFKIGDSFYSGDEINPIPVGASIATHAFFSPDRKPMPVDKFLSKFVPFTFFFEYHDKKYRRSFTHADIDPIVREYLDVIRKQEIKPPHVTVRQVSNPIDWDKWDALDRFKLYEIACLWECYLPSLPLPSQKARDRFEALSRDIESGGLKVVRENLGEVIKDAIAKTNNVPVAANPYWIVARDTAMEYCEKLGAEPALFYPKKRV